MKDETFRAQVFLVRGLAREAAHWGKFPDKLRRHFSQVEIITLDLPGTGVHHRLRAPLSVAATAQFVRREFMQKRQPGVPAYVFAVSLGAMVVVEWLHQDDSHVDGVILANTSFKGCSPFWYRLWIEAFPHLMRALREPRLEKRERHVLAMVSNRPELYTPVAREWAAIQRQRPIRVETFVRQLFAASRYAPPLKAPRVPVLLLNSLRDRMVHPSCSEAIAGLWNCELRRHATAGHDLPLDAGTWVAAAIAEWIAEVQRTNTRRK